MGGEWELRTFRHNFSDLDQWKWKRACKVLFFVAREQGFKSALCPEDEDGHVNSALTRCSRCSNKKCSKALVVWNPSTGAGVVEVPISLNGALFRCTYDPKNHCSRGPYFEVNGCVEWSTFKFNRSLEAVLGYLFPNKFHVCYDIHNIESPTDVEYFLSTKEAELKDELPEGCIPVLRRIKRKKCFVVPRLLDLCISQLKKSSHNEEELIKLLVDLQIETKLFPPK